ncbi:hypothetical protein Plhal304r1_c068g0156311 [Plasmopara halstedii]
MALLGGNKRYESPVEDPEPDVAKNGSFKSLYEENCEHTRKLSDSGWVVHSY